MNNQLLYHIMICENAREIVDDIERILTDFGKRIGIQIRFYSHYEMERDLGQLTNISPVIDLMIMDIDFCGQGIHIARTILKAKPWLPIIFIGDEEVQLERTDKLLAIGFLKKPFNQARLGILFYRALGQIDLVNQYYGRPNLTFVINKRKITIPCACISSLEKIQKKVIIKHRAGTAEVRMTLKEVEPCLPRNFLRISQSVIVNVNDLLSISGRWITMNNLDEFIVGRTYCKRVTEYFQGIHDSVKM